MSELGEAAQFDRPIPQLILEAVQQRQERGGWGRTTSRRDFSEWDRGESPEEKSKGPGVLVSVLKWCWAAKSADMSISWWIVACLLPSTCGPLPLMGHIPVLAWAQMQQEEFTPFQMQTSHDSYMATSLDNKASTNLLKTYEQDKSCLACYYLCLLF